MTREVWIQVLNVYVQFLVFSYMTFYVLCNSYPLKISKRKAYLIAFIYANYMPVTDALSLVLVGGGIIPNNSFIYILLKINIVLEVLVYLLFILLYVDKIWYRAYWWAITLMMFLSLPNVLYSNKFITLDPVKGATVHVVTGKSLVYYLLVLLVYIAVGILFVLVGKKLGKIKKFDQISKWNWYIFYSCFAFLILNSEKDYFLKNTNLKAISNYKNMVLFTFISAVILLISINQAEKRRLKSENLLLRQQKKMHYANYLSMQEKEEEILRLHQDIGQHLKSIQEMINRSEHREAEAYTKELKQQYQNIRREFFCNNKIINAVLSSKMNKCQELGVNFNIDLKIPDQMSIRDID